MIETDYLKNNLDIIKKLKQIPTLSHFDNKDIDGLMKLSKMRKYERGEIIIAEGSFDKWIYFLISGRVKIVKDGEQVATIKRTGDIFGEMSVINDVSRSASVYSVEDTVCLATDVSYIDRLTGKDKLAFGYVLYRIFSEILAERLRQTTEELMKSKKLDFL